MRLKITNPKIPGVLVGIGIIGALINTLSTTETLSVTGAIILLSASILLTFIYFPILTIVLFGDKIENKDKVVNNIGIFSVSFIMLGLFLRLSQLPGAGPVIVIGSMIFYLNFVPAWFAANYKNSDWYQRALNFVFCTVLGLMIAMHHFKTMHWPGGNILANLTFNIGLYILIPFGIITLLFKRQKKYFSLSTTFIFGFIIAYVISGVASMKIANNRFAADNKNQVGIENNLRLYEAKNKFLYDAFESTKINDSSALQYKRKAEELKKISQNTFDYIYQLKTNIVLIANKLPETARDSITFENIKDKTNYDHATYLLIGSDPNHPRTDSGSAIELKSKLQHFISTLDTIAPEEVAFQLKSANPFDFKDVETEDGGRETWEIQNFNMEPLSTVYTTLTGYQANVRYMEMTLLNELFNKANANNKENIAAQLAELAIKYETQKQEKKIALLQKDQEMTDLQMQAKDAEISNRENTITIFTFGTIIFGILMVFVIRSNILRKQTNKELALQKDIISSQKDEVENQKHLVEEKQKEIVDSITYAKRLQEAILPSTEFVNQYLPNNFILYKPKDLVAGDFYWMEIADEKIFIAAADSTGHGVPGAMVSVVCSNALNRALKEFKLRTPGELLDKTRELVLETFSKSSSDVKDGMDISLLCIDKNNNTILWSGANNPLWFIDTLHENPELQEIKADKQPIGKTDHPKPFTNHPIPYKAGTVFYLFTDGYADQFGGPKGKKFKYKQLEDLLMELSSKNMPSQREMLDAAFESWKSNIEQVDDVCIIGIRI